MRIIKILTTLLANILLITTLSAQNMTVEDITSGAIQQTGGIYVYYKADKYYLQIPQSALHRDIIWYAEISRGPLVQGLAGSDSSPGSMIDNRVIRLEQHEDRLFIRDNTAPLDLRPASASGETAQNNQDRRLFERSLQEATLPPILMAFPILAMGTDGSFFIDASAIFNRALPQFNPAEKYPNLGRQDPNRSYLADIRTFDDNLQVKSILTYDVVKSNNPLAALFGSINSKAATIEVSHSIYLLPEKQMMPRLADPRVGYFKTNFTEAGPEGGAELKAYISRYRLEKKDPEAALSEPVEPIVYYIGPNVPPRFREAFKQGVEDWNTAFEAAGFRNAIVAKDPPDDPNWNPSDLGYSVIRWVGQPIANAIGPRVVDPRTGEILSAHVLIWEKVVEIASQWYYLEGSASDPDAQQLPLPNEVLDRMMRYIVSHEVGHSLGLRHNHRASQAYTTEQLRDPDFTDKSGPAASIMSYGRINYVAQPGDGVTQLVPIIGPYDKLAIKYGYQPIPGAETPEEEIPTLNEWLEVQRTNDVLLWGGEDLAAQHDPMVVTENIGRDHIEATKLGLKNLQRAVEGLPKAIGTSPQDIGDMKSIFQEAMNLRSTWLKATAKELYGVLEYRTLEVDKPSYKLVSPERKREVTRFLLEQLKKPTDLVTPQIERIYMPYELSKIISDSQSEVLNSLMDKRVFTSITNAGIVGQSSYSVARYLEEIRKGLFAELEDPRVTVDPVRRQLQAIFVGKLAALVNPPSSAQAGVTDTELRGAARMVLQILDSQVEQAEKNAREIDTRAHLYDLQKEIEAAL